MTQSKSGLFFCCREHKDLAQRFDGIDEINLPHYGNGQWCYRVMALRKKGSVCERCGYGKHVAAITVHHKDRDRTNNAMDNLEVLCANCHAIEHHG
jgi:5-methylcytosine-specific restriction endonuclease McrA